MSSIGNTGSTYDRKLFDYKKRDETLDIDKVLVGAKRLVQLLGSEVREVNEVNENGKIAKENLDFAKNFAKVVIDTKDAAERYLLSETQESYTAYCVNKDKLDEMKAKLASLPLFTNEFYNHKSKKRKLS